jgi:hypothetical protein
VRRRPFLPAPEIRNRLAELFGGLLEKYPGWTFADLRRLTLRQVTDILLLPREGRERVPAEGDAGNGRTTGAVTALPGPPTLEKELADLDRVRAFLRHGLSEESYQRAREKIKKKYDAERSQRGERPPGETG